MVGLMLRRMPSLIPSLSLQGFLLGFGLVAGLELLLLSLRQATPDGPEWLLLPALMGGLSAVALPAIEKIRRRPKAEPSASGIDVLERYAFTLAEAAEEQGSEARRKALVAALAGLEAQLVKIPPSTLEAALKRGAVRAHARGQPWQRWAMADAVLLRKGVTTRKVIRERRNNDRRARAADPGAAAAAVSPARPTALPGPQPARVQPTEAVAGMDGEAGVVEVVEVLAVDEAPRRRSRPSKASRDSGRTPPIEGVHEVEDVRDIRDRGPAQPVAPEPAGEADVRGEPAAQRAARRRRRQPAH